VIFDKFSYQAVPATPGLFTIAGRPYTPQGLSRLKFPEMPEPSDDPRSQRLQGISVMLLGKVYGSVGERVFADQMQLSGVGKVLLLPVAPDGGDPSRFEGRMRWVSELYGDEERFWLAGSVPVSLPGEEIAGYAANLKRRYGIRAMKCHPVVSGLDLGAAQGKEWLESLLSACQQSKLPLVIHGGRNNLYFGGNRGNFGSLHHLNGIDFSLSQQPVVIAHAGFHRCRLQEIEQEGVPMLQRMLERHGNLYVDSSGLGVPALKLMLGAVDPERVLFGSDALYYPQWEAAVSAMHALKELGLRWEERFLQMACGNPERTVFRGEVND
jgi:predicted TIM-barrel fold metal-dependent hydrolase